MSSTQDIERFRARMATGEPVRVGDEIFALIHAFAQDALRVCAEINGSYHEPAELRRLFSRLIGATPRPSSRPPSAIPPRARGGMADGGRDDGRGVAPMSRENSLRSSAGSW